MAYEFRKGGVTLPYTDIIIAAAAVSNNATLLHIDKHFDLIAKKGNMKVESFVKRSL